MTPHDAARFLELAKRQEKIHRVAAGDEFQDVVQGAALKAVERGLRFTGENDAGLVWTAIHLELLTRRRYANNRGRFYDGSEVQDGDEEFGQVMVLVDPEAVPEPWFWQHLEALVPRIQAGSLRTFRAWVAARGDVDRALEILDSDPARPILGRAVGNANPSRGGRRDNMTKAVKKIMPYALRVLGGEG